MLFVNRTVTCVPASSANLGPGFDTFACALALHTEIEIVETGRFAVQTDLEIARDIQVSLFPRELPRIAGIELYGVSLPAKVVGGDFYDFLPVDGGFDGRVALVVGDVSGKSIPASLLMVAAKEIVYARSMQDPEPSTVFRESNRRIYEIKRRMFVSLGYFLYYLLQMTGARGDEE